jgi:hypothetical protein
MCYGPPQYDPERPQSIARPQNREEIAIFLGRLLRCLPDSVVLRVQYENRYDQNVNAGCQKATSRRLFHVKPEERVESPGNPGGRQELQFAPSVWSPKPGLQKLRLRRCNSVKKQPSLLLEALHAGYSRSWRLLKLATFMRQMLWLEVGVQTLSCSMMPSDIHVTLASRASKSTACWADPLDKVSALRHNVFA